MIRLRRKRNGPIDCRAVGRALQSYLDHDLDDDVAARIAEHLEACRHCGLEADTYRAIKRSLAAHRPAVDADAVERLRAFGDRLTAGDG